LNWISILYTMDGNVCKV